jgi:hypothetical protein
LRRIERYGERVAMEKQLEPNPEQDHPAQAATHIASARQILKALQEEIGEHPELGAAILKLEMALNILTIKTGGLM